MNLGFFQRVASLLLLVLLGISFPVVVQAQAGALVTSVSPATIFSDESTVITVAGSGFDADSRIFLDGVEVPGTVVNSDSQLQVTVPAGLSVGSHLITVDSNGTPAGGSVSLMVVPRAAPVVRPQIGVEIYRTKPQPVTYGQDFILIVKLRNEGQAQAHNVQATFTSTDYLPTKNGGVEIVGDILPDNSKSIEQPMVVGSYVYGFVSVEMNLSYTDANGTAYAEKFTLNIESIGGGGAAAATATPTGVKDSQLVITSYATSVDPLQPGQQFNLTMTVQNVGNVGAQRVTMIVGGGSSGGSSDGTPQPGGVSGGSGEFTNFAPVGASNVQTLGDIQEGAAVQARQDLIVNVSTNPGAYPMKVTFSYVNPEGEIINDEQVITLLVYSLPTLDISFYRPPDPFFVGQPGALPIQVVNLGRRTAVLGTMTIRSEGGMIENGTSLVGSLDAGGFFTIDALVFPEQAGPMTLDVTIDYTDDFNQPRTVNRTLEIEVMEAFEEPTLEPGLGEGEMFPPQAEESTLQKIWRFLLGLLGLDSAAPSNSDPGISPGIEQPLPVPPGRG